MVVSIIIAAFCGANFVYDENNKVFVSSFTYRLMHFLQIYAHSKSDTDITAGSRGAECAAAPPAV